LLGLDGSTGWVDLAAHAAAIVPAAKIFITFRGLKAQSDPVAEIVQCGEPIFSMNWRRRPARGSVLQLTPPLN